MTSRLRNLVRAVAKKLGVQTPYHVAATYSRDSHMGLSILSLTCSVKPWLHLDNYPELVEYVKTQAERPVSTPTITSIMRLGT